MGVAGSLEPGGAQIRTRPGRPEREDEVDRGTVEDQGVRRGGRMGAAWLRSQCEHAAPGHTETPTP